MKTMQMEVPPADAAWGPTEVAQFLGISIRHLSQTRASDTTFPHPRMIGRLPRWAAPAIRDWLAGPEGQPQRGGAARLAARAGQRVY